MSLTKDAKNKGGRPVGSVETPERMLRREAKNHLGLMKSLRDLVDKQVEEVGRQLKDKGLSIETRLEYAERLAELIATMSKAVESIAKIDKGGIFGDKEGSAGEVVTLEDIAKEFEGRK